MTDYVDGFIDFLTNSPTPYHAVQKMSARLSEAGFEVLEEHDSWSVRPGGRYFCTRNGSSIIAFVAGREGVGENGLRLVGAHTDSPCLKIKPIPESVECGYQQLGVEVYGGALLNPWFDRDLSIAGRVSVEASGKLCNLLIDFRRAVALVPSLAIHLDSSANKGREVNAQTQMPAVLSLAEPDADAFGDMLLAQVNAEHSSVNADKVLAFELSLYDTQIPAITGIKQEFISAARLDNLLSCYVGLQALLESDASSTAVLVCNDHEEVGSQSAAGAQGPMLSSLIARLLPDHETRSRALARSMLISADNAHGIHPNFADKHDSNHGPMINAGPVIKINSNQRYASNSETAAAFRWLCDQRDVPVQTFVVRSDMRCGSTIGPITAAELGVRTLDIGVPTWAMHSIREHGGVADLGYLHKALSAFYRLEDLPI